MTDAKHTSELTASEHTPGPWEADPTGSIFGDMDTDHDGDNPFVARVGAVGAYSEREKADARLIAAAPDLLAALDYLLEQTVDQDLKYGIGLTEGEEDARTQALAAIASATGHTVAA